MSPVTGPQQTGMHWAGINLEGCSDINYSILLIFLFNLLSESLIPYVTLNLCRTSLLLSKVGRQYFYLSYFPYWPASLIGSSQITETLLARLTGQDIVAAAGYSAHHSSLVLPTTAGVLFLIILNCREELLHCPKAGEKAPTW